MVGTIIMFNLTKDIIEFLCFAISISFLVVIPSKVEI